jgi:hydrogenase nickel insertion protein HypA
MHEYSIVQALLDQCEAVVRDNNATRVHKVVVKIGKMSGVEPHLLEVAFDTFKEASLCRGAQFVMDVQPLVIECLDCGVQTPLEEIVYKCPACESLNVRVVDGEGMYLMSLEIE